ncbi:MAG: hypothetical protein WBQ94_03740 [Terracidiphilus sp.]
MTDVEKPAPLVDVVMYNLLGDDWKTTMQGFLSFLALNGATAAVAVQAFGAQHPKIQEYTTGIGLGITTAASIAKWYIGVKQKG